MVDIVVTDAAGATLKHVDVGDGNRMPNFSMGARQTKEYFEAVRYTECRDDDVMLLSYPKTGSNWLYEIVSMILNKSVELVSSTKGETMLEMASPETVALLPSPRVLHTHLKYRYIPQDLHKKQIKTVMVLRNPKDAAVSLYNASKGIYQEHYGYDGEWKNYLPLWIQGELEYGKYTAYLRAFDQAIQDGVGFPLHVMFYEDLKLNGPAEIDKLVEFLDVKLDDNLKQCILDKCSFQNMSKEKIRISKDKEGFYHNGYNFFRKGEIGDWRNWFTVAENEMFDKIWHDEMKGCTRFNFKYGNDK